MANDPADATRLERTLAKATAAALAVSRAEGPDVFGDLACRLAEILAVDATMIARFDGPPGRMTALAACLDGRLLRTFQYDLEHTPCRAMLDRESRFVARGVRSEFAPGTLFHEKGFDSYAALSIVDGHGRQIGLIAAMDRQPLTDRPLIEALLQVFAVRAAAEFERRRADEAASASEASYRAIFDAAEDSIFVHDIESGRIVDVNPKACRTYGYSHDELLNVRISDVSSNRPPYTEVEAARYMEQARRGEPVRFEWQRRNKDGSLHWDEVVLKRATIDGKERILTFTREITDRKEAHEALRLREEQYRAIFEGSADALVLWSRDVRIVDVNAAFTAIYGYTREEIVGSTFGDRLPTLDVARRIRMMQRALEGHTGLLETRTIRKSGEAFDVEIRYLPISHRGEPHVLAIARDITERRRAEAALRTSEAQYRAIFNASADALVLWDSQFTIVDVNPAFERIYRMKRADVVGRGYPSEMPADYVEQRLQLVRRALDGETQELTTQARRGDGTVFDVELRVIPILHRGEPHALAIARDVTESRQAEIALRASEAQYRSIFEAATDSLQLLDARHRVVDVNPAYERMYGKRRDEVVGKGLDELAPAAFRAERRALVDRALAGEVAELQSTGFRGDGTPFDLEVRCMPFEHHGERHVLGIARDITERKSAEKALRASEEQYRGIFNASVDGLVLQDAEHRIVDVNAAFLAMHGYSREELIGRRLSDFLPAELEERCEVLVPRILSGAACHIEARTRRRDGTAFDVEIHGVPMQYAGRPHALVIMRDITEATRAEQRLRASEARYRTLFEMESAAVLLVDVETLQLVDVNLAAVQMYGYTREELLRMTATDLSAEPEATAPSIRDGKGAINVPLRWHRRKGGSTFPVEITANRLELDGRRIVLATTRDITERKHAEQALRDSEEQYKAIFNASADALVLRDADFRIVDVNATYEAMSGYTREEVLGVDRIIANPPEVADSIRALHVRALAGEPIDFETPFLRRDGKRYELELRGVPILHRGAPHVLYIGRDVTARKRAESRRQELESQLRQAQKMEAIGHLTGGIAHDFNNILTSVMGYVALATERPAAEADPKLQSHLAQAEQSCHRARDLIQQMLAFSRGQRGEARPVALRSLLSESTRMLRATLPASVELVSHVAGDPVARVDPVQAHQVLLNLCINARDAMGETGRIVASAGRVRVTEMTCASCRHRFSGDFAELTVTDSGSGIAPEVMERMFDPFFSTKETGQGTGMGLSIVHGVVHEHGGHVLVESRRGGGTTFRVLLPLAPEEALEAGGGTSGTVGGRGPLTGRVLLVEDEQSVLGFMRELLQGWGLTVVGARDPSEALQWFSMEPDRFDVVITDHTMPVMTGLELARALLAKRCDLPVLLYSGRSELLDAQAVTAAGVRRMLSKPIDVPALHSELRAVLARPGP